MVIFPRNIFSENSLSKSDTCINFFQLANELGTCVKPEKDVGTGDSISMASDKKREMEAASKFFDVVS